MAYEEVEYTGWFSRMGKSFGGIVIGFLMIPICIAVLFWNEGRAVTRAKSLAEGAASVVSLNDISKVDAAMEGKLIHLSGEATTAETLSDSQFPVSAPAIRLNRTVQVYQWKEKSETRTEKQIGGGQKQVTTYTYERVWSTDSPVDSSTFKEQAGHQQRAGKPYQDAVVSAKEVKVGGYQLNSSQVGRIPEKTNLPVTAEMEAKLSEGLRGKLKAVNGVFYASVDGGSSTPDSPQIGDARISFDIVNPQTISIVARQVKGTFEPYMAAAGSAIDDLRGGTLSAQAMFKAMEDENTLLTWILRIVGCVVMGIGFFLIFQPLVTLADILPFLGNLVSAGVGLFAALSALALSLMTIAVGWLFYRPLIGIPLVLASVGLIVLLARMGKSRKPARA